MTPEGKVKKKVSELLQKHKCYYEMPVPSGFGKSGLDYTAAINGRAFAIETKAGTKQMTPRQEQMAISMRAAGMEVFLINEETGTAELERWLSEQITCD